MKYKRFLFLVKFLLLVNLFPGYSWATSKDYYVDPSTGYLIYSKTDLNIPGIIPVNITRYYQAGSTAIGAFGRGTYFEYDWLLLAYGADGQINNSNPTMYLLIKPGNYQYRFDIKQIDGSFINDRDPEMTGAIIVKHSDNSRTLRMRDGWSYKFNSNGRLIEMIDRNGNKLIFIRRTAFEGEFLTEIIMPDGKKLSFNQTYVCCPNLGFFRTDSIIDSSGRAIKYIYETDNISPYYPRLKKVEYPDGSSIEYFYDSSNRISGIKNERGIVEVSIEYDSDNRVTRLIYPDGGQYIFSYTIAGGFVTETSMIAPDGAVKTWRFNSWKYITEITTPDGTTVYERDPQTNRILSIRDPLGRRTVYTYDSKGRTSAIIDNVGNVTRYEYEDTFNMPVKITDALGNITTMAYDSQGNLISITDPLGNTTNINYNSIGRPVAITDALGNTTTMDYDSAGNLISVTDPLGNSTSMAYDSLGRLIEVKDAGGKRTFYNYDIKGRIIEIIDPLDNKTRYFYDKRGNLIKVRDAKGQIIRYEYDNKDRPVKMTDQLGRIETYEYDLKDNLVKLTDRKGQITTYTFDLMNRLIRVNYADGSYTTYTYDAGGRLIYIYDSISGPIEYIYSDTGCSGSCSGVDKVIKEITPLGSISYEYDALGRRTKMQVDSQPAVNYSYDANGRLVGINTIINGIQSLFSLNYDQLGRRVSLSYPNGVRIYYTYDNASHLLEMKHLNPLNQILESLSYVYDPGGNRTGMERLSMALPLPNPASNITYNQANQMLTFKPEGGIIKEMEYDENGNLLRVKNGCGVTDYTWDARNRLVGISGFDRDCNPLNAGFKYDALGRRIEKTINGKTTRYLYDGLDIIQEIENGAVTANYIRTLNIDEPLARIKSDGSVRYYQQDALGSVIALTDENGAIKTRYSYDPYGSVTITGESSDNPFQYTGREKDNTGLYYYRARYYSPELQRFISEDPRLRPMNSLYTNLKSSPMIKWIVPSLIKEPSSFNNFLYVVNDPINYVDPLGLDRYEWCGGSDKAMGLCKCLTDWACSIIHPEYCCKSDFIDCMNKAKSDKEEAECALKYSLCLATLGS